MVDTPTRKIADEVVSGLSLHLSSLRTEGLPGVRSVFITGSYARGDWLDSNSDLDINVLYRADASDDAAWRRSVDSLKSVTAGILDGRHLRSHCPGGIDWGTHPGIPATDAEARVIGPYPYHGVFMFDFVQNTRVLWGEDFLGLLPAPPDPADLALPALDYWLGRIGGLGTDADDRRRASYVAYKATLLLQLVFGEKTFDKTRLLHLFLRHVPDFPSKHIGEHVIRGYIGASYPDRPPQCRDVGYYSDYLRESRILVGDRRRRPLPSA